MSKKVFITNIVQNADNKKEVDEYVRILNLQGYIVTLQSEVEEELSSSPYMFLRDFDEIHLFCEEELKLNPEIIPLIGVSMALAKKVIFFGGSNIQTLSESWEKNRLRFKSKVYDFNRFIYIFLFLRDLITIGAFFWLTFGAFQGAEILTFLWCVMLFSIGFASMMTNLTDRY